MKLFIKSGIKMQIFSAILFILSVTVLSCGDAITETMEHLVHSKKPKIIFTMKNDTAHKQIYEMDLDGSNMKRLTNLSEDCNSPSWSPDGDYFVFYTGSVIKNNLKIHRMNHDGTGLKTIANGKNPTYYLDGKKLLYISTDLKTLYSANSNDGSETAELTSETGSNIQALSWSPDGKKIAYIYGGGANKKIDPFLIFGIYLSIKNRLYLFKIKLLQYLQPKIFKVLITIGHSLDDSDFGIDTFSKTI